MTSNRDFLVKDLEATPLFAGRYKDVKCVNYDAALGKKSGYFSLVFRAFDVVEQKPVALKFFDIDAAVFQDTYRIQAFDREPEILKILLGQERCLQLAGELSTHNLKVDAGGGFAIEIRCKYFVVDWLDEGLDDIFFGTTQITAEGKLRLFNEIVLAVEALHRLDVHHRDLKPDNLRAYTEAMKRIVVAIDLGTAARLDSPALLLGYGNPVGAIQYAAPETFCGFAGDRKFAYLSDIYALGCLLFELFNQDLFIAEVRRTPTRDIVLAAMALDLHGVSPEHRLAGWSKSFQRLGKSISPVSIAAPGHSVPLSIRSQLDQILARLTHFDITQRAKDLEAIRRTLWTAIHVLKHEKEQQRRDVARRLLRQRRLDKLTKQEGRLASFLEKARKNLIQQPESQ